MIQQEIRDKRTFLIEKLKKENVFWPYESGSVKNDDLSDDFLIEKTLIHLDISEINILFAILPKKEIRRVWEEKMLPQGEYLFNLNKFLAWFYFDIHNDDEYVRENAYKRLA